MFKRLKWVIFRVRKGTLHLGSSKFFIDFCNISWKIHEHMIIFLSWTLPTNRIDKFWGMWSQLLLVKQWKRCEEHVWWSQIIPFWSTVTMQQQSEEDSTFENIAFDDDTIRFWRKSKTPHINARVGNSSHLYKSWHRRLSCTVTNLFTGPFKH